MVLLGAMVLTAWAGVSFAQGHGRLPPPDLGAPPKAAPAAASGGTASAAPKVPARPLPSVTISARVEQTSVPRDETVRLLIEMEWEDTAAEPSPPLDFEFPDPPSAEGLTLFANSFRAQTELSGNAVKIKRLYTYEFHAEREGDVRIGEVSVNYSWIGSEDKAVLMTQAIPVTITGPAIKPGRLSRHPVFIAGLVLVALGSVFMLAWPWIKSKRKSEDEAEPERSVHEIARERLREADKLRMAGDYDSFLMSLSHEVARYLEEALEVKARATSPDRIAKALAEKFGEEWKGRITEFEKLCNKVKFAGHKPDGSEMDMAMKTAKALVAEGERRSPAIIIDETQ